MFDINNGKVFGGVAAAGIILVITVLGWSFSVYSNDKKESGEESSGISSKPAVIPVVSGGRLKSVSSTNSTDVDGIKDVKIRGYKKTSDGKTTTYFNRELSQKDAVLLGDCSPQRISSSGSTASTSPKGDSPQPNNQTSPISTSQWNKAGTWEDRDISHWALTHLKSCVMSLGAPAELPAGVRKEMEGLGLMTALHHAPMQATDDDGDYKLSVLTRPSKCVVSGDANVTHSRGKTYYVYDLSMEVDWQLMVQRVPVSQEINASNVASNNTLENFVIVGKMKVSEISSDLNFEFQDMGNVEVRAGTKNTVLSKAGVQWISGKTSVWRQQLSAAIGRFDGDMKKKY